MTDVQQAVVDMLKSHLKDAEEGKITGVMIVRTNSDGGLSFGIQSSQAIPVALIGAMEWAKEHFLRQAAHKQAEAIARQQEAEASK